MKEPGPVRLENELAAVPAPWRPRVVAALNGQEVKVARLHGPFAWHAHANADELFLVLAGRFRLELEGRKGIELREGELYIVPRGVRHRPVAEDPCEVLLFEPAGVVNTGDAAPSALTAPAPSNNTLRPRREPGAYVFVPAPGGYGAGAELGPVAAVREREGWCLVVPEPAADAAGLPYDGAFALISFDLESGLSDVGLTAAVSAALAAAAVPCNVLAGLRHDHVLVPTERADAALAVLNALAVPGF